MLVVELTCGKDYVLLTQLGLIETLVTTLLQIRGKPSTHSKESSILQDLKLYKQETEEIDQKLTNR